MPNVCFYVIKWRGAEEGAQTRNGSDLKTILLSTYMSMCAAFFKRWWGKKDSHQTMMERNTAFSPSLLIKHTRGLKGLFIFSSHCPMRSERSMLLPASPSLCLVPVVKADRETTSIHSGAFSFLWEDHERDRQESPANAWQIKDSP